MDGAKSENVDEPGSSTVSIAVLSVTPARAGKLFAASVEIDIDGARIEVHRIRALRVDPIGTRIEQPIFRDASGLLRTAITLPEEARGLWRLPSSAARRR
jgi:hypothetical protein